LDLSTSSVLRPICLPEDVSITYYGNKAIVAGWGLTKPNADFPSLPHEVEMTILKSRCDIKDIPFSKAHMLCVGQPGGGKDSCKGDSGGPLIVEVNGRYKQVGIVSGGPPDCRGPGVYTRITKYRKWIRTYSLKGLCTYDGNC
ncbi:unnamed protein product, partial [Meganyctiphanes norvegica]